MKCASITKINLSKSNIEANSNEQILFDKFGVYLIFMIKDKVDNELTGLVFLHLETSFQH